MTLYGYTKGAISSWCASHGYTPRAEIASMDGKNLPNRFVLYVQENNGRIWYADSPARRTYDVQFDVAVPVSEAARLPDDFESLDAVLLGAGYVPTGSYDFATDHDARKAYITARYRIELPIGGDEDDGAAG